MAKVIEGYAYTTGENAGTGKFSGIRYVDSTRLESPKVFTKDLATPIWLNHEGPTEAILLDAFHTALGMYIKVLVQDDKIAETCTGFSIGYTLGGLKKGKLDEISLICGDDRRPGNRSCTVNDRRDPTPDELGILGHGDVAGVKSGGINSLIAKIAAMQSICCKAGREIREADKTPEQLHQEKMANRRKLLGQDEVRTLSVQEFTAFRKSASGELECDPALIMIS